MAVLGSTWLCTSCFSNLIEAKVKSAIYRYGMIKPGESVCVGLSGGKDSATLLLVLKKIAPKIRISRLVATTLDEGISNYREEAVRLAKFVAERADVEHLIIRFKDVFGFDLDDLASKCGKSLCSICGVLRRRALDMAAKEFGCKVIATGHTREDIAQTFIMNILRGEPQRLARTTSKTDGTKGFIPRIKPLSYLSEREVALYAYLFHVEFQKRACPYRVESLRLQVLTTLNKMESIYPNISTTLTRSLERSKDILSVRYRGFELKSCTICGYPSTKDICMVCQLTRGRK
ncbi:MAG: TIGR00269 family protein [Thermoproteota archaeon]